MPFSLGVRLSRGRPNWAFYLPPKKGEIGIDDYLGEFKCFLDPTSDIERRMLSRTYETDTLAILRKFIKAGHSVFDIGANVGAITLAMAQMTGPTGRVESFEPCPKFGNRLARNVAANPRLTKIVRWHAQGVSDSVGELALQEAPNDPGTATMHWVDANKPSLRVPVTTIDQFVQSEHIDSVHFIKIDVDGMDDKVIAGGLETIARHRPGLLFETTMCDEGQRNAAKSIAENLATCDYGLYKIVDDAGNYVATKYPDLSFNTLGLPNS